MLVLLVFLADVKSVVCLMIFFGKDISEAFELLGVSLDLVPLHLLILTFEPTEMDVCEGLPLGRDQAFLRLLFHY